MSTDDICIIGSPPTSSNIDAALSSTASSISFPTNTNASSPSSFISLISTSSKTNSPSSSSSINLMSYTSERISYLLKTYKENFGIISNTASSAVALHWLVFGFPAKLNKENGNFERILGFTSCRKCKKTFVFVYGQHSGTNNMKQHSCVADHSKASSSTESLLQQTKIDKLVMVRRTLTSEQSNTIKDLTVHWTCQDIRPISIVEDSGLRALVHECVRLGSIYGNIDVNDVLRGRTTISNHIQNFARSCRERIKELLEEPYKNGCLSISPNFIPDLEILRI